MQGSGEKARVEEVVAPRSVEAEDGAIDAPAGRELGVVGVGVPRCGTAWWGWIVSGGVDDGFELWH